MATLKDGKVAFSQKAVRWDETTTTLKEIIAFSDYLKDPSTTTPLTQFSAQHHPLIAKLVHESDKAIAALSKHVKRLLMRRCDGSLANDDKALLDDPRIPIDAITTAVNDVAERVNYGIEGAPAALSLWRWEVKDVDAMLPSPTDEPSCNSDLAKQRRQERNEARTALKAAYDSLNDEEKERILKKQSKKKADEPSASTTADATSIKESPKVSKKTASENKPVTDTKEKGKAPAVTKEVKPKNNKQAQMMSNFFKAPAKPKPVTADPAKAPTQSDFEKTFKPFLVKKDTRVAPISQFLEERQNSINGKGKGKEAPKNLLVLDDDGDVEMEIIEIDSTPSSPAKSIEGTAKEDEDVSGLTPRELIDKFLSSVPPSRLVSRNRRTASSQGTRLKSSWPSPISVRNMMTQLTEASVVGDAKTTRKLQKLLKDRKRIPVKLLQFHDNSRPGYYGTWTKSSSQVGPRTPFGKDLVAFDYSYDSGQEWEEEPEDAEEVTGGLDDDSDSLGDEDEDEGEFDDFLVPDEEVEESALDAEIRRSLSPTPIGGVEKYLGVKRKAGKELKENKKKKVFKPLIPYTAGPCWEKRIGESTDTFKGFRIQLLNDAPFPIDPFTWISEPIVTDQNIDNAASSTEATLAPNGVSASQSKDGFAVPALPPHLHPSNQVNLPPNPNVLSPSLDKLTINSTPTTSQKSKPPAKAFPQTYLAELLKLIHGSTDTKVVLVDKIATHFRTKEEDEVKRKVKKKREVVKGVVEAAVKDFAVKVEKTWKVKDEAWATAGVVPPTAA